MGVEKAMGLKKGEKIKKIGMIRVVSAKAERLREITPEDVVREGFPGWTTGQFIEMLSKYYGASSYSVVNRIEFEYI
jgi:hypothetical protein